MGLGTGIAKGVGGILGMEYKLLAGCSSSHTCSTSSWSSLDGVGLKNGDEGEDLFFQ